MSELMYGEGAPHYAVMLVVSYSDVMNTGVSCTKLVFGSEHALGPHFFSASAPTLPCCLLSTVYGMGAQNERTRRGTPPSQLASSDFFFDSFSFVKNQIHHVLCDL